MSRNPWLAPSSPWESLCLMECSLNRWRVSRRSVRWPVRAITSRTHSHFQNSLFTLKTTIHFTPKFRFRLLIRATFHIDILCFFVDFSAFCECLCVKFCLQFSFCDLLRQHNWRISCLYVCLLYTSGPVGQRFRYISVRIR